jgi:ubiquinone/menaquinone biosynthesis C-methylase UbiE
MSYNIKSIKKSKLKKTLKKTSNKTSNKTLKKTLKKTKNINVIPPELSFAIKNINNISKCSVETYKNMLNPVFNFKNEYKPSNSNKQIEAILKISEKDPDYYFRFLSIVLKKFNPKLLNEVINVIKPNKTDIEIYKELNDIYESDLNKKSQLKTIPSACSKNKTLAYNLYYDISNSIVFDDIHNYLDIGAGNGVFTYDFGKLFNLKKNNINGVDFENYAEKKDWFKNRNKLNINFKKIKNNEKYPYNNSSFDLITSIMVLHHIDNLDFYLKDIKRILKKNGYFIIVEHDNYTYGDDMLCDVEHILYETTFNDNFKNLNELEQYNIIKNSQKIHYKNWLKFDYILSKYGFTYIKGGMNADIIKFETKPNRSFWSLYKNTF